MLYNGKIATQTHLRLSTSNTLQWKGGKLQIEVYSGSCVVYNTNCVVENEQLVGFNVIVVARNYTVFSATCYLYSINCEVCKCTM